MTRQPRTPVPRARAGLLDLVLMSYASGDQVRLAGFRSVAAPAAALSGRWG